MLRLAMTCLTLVVLALCATTTWSQDDRYVLRLSDTVGPPGSQQTVGLFLDIVNGTLGAPFSILGFGYGVCHDPAVLDLVDVSLGSTMLTINSGSQPDFYVADLNPTTGAGWTLGVLIDGQGAVSLPPGVGYEMNTITYDLIGVPGSVATVDFCDSLGVPAVQTLVVETSWASAVPVQISGQVSIEFLGFRRGDCDGDGNFQLGDMVFLLGFLFPQSGVPAALPCLLACDSNDDDVIDLGDVLAGLLALFAQPSVSLPAPYPDCGFDPTPGNLTCSQVTLCP